MRREITFRLAVEFELTDAQQALLGTLQVVDEQGVVDPDHTLATSLGSADDSIFTYIATRLNPALPHLLPDVTVGGVVPAGMSDPDQTER